MPEVLPEAFEGRLFQSNGRMIGEHEDVIAFPYRSYQDYKNYLHVVTSGIAKDYLLPNSEGMNSACVSAVMTARDETWIAFNIPITINQYHIGDDAVTLVSSITLGDSRSRLKDLIKLDNGKLFVAWHQFERDKVDGEGNPGIDVGFAYRTLDGNWHTLPYTWVFPFTIPATQGAVCQHPDDDSIWFFCQPDSYGTICVIHLAEIEGEISVDWTDYDFLNEDDGAMAPEGELPFFSAIGDKQRNAIILTYQSLDRYFFSTDPFCKGAKPAIIQINSDGSKSLLFVLDRWLERISPFYVGLNNQNEVWLAYGKIDEVNLTWNDLYISTENGDQYCGEMQYGIPGSAIVRLCNSSRLAVATMVDSYIHFFNVKESMAIYIGADAIDRTSNFGTFTIINKENPANATGIIDTVHIWAVYNMTGCKVGTFYTTNGNTLKCRAVVEIGNVTAGAKRTFDDLSLAVVAGDYIGLFYTAGGIERGTEGFAGLWFGGYKVDHLIVGDEATYSSLSSGTISLYGTGEEVGGYYHGLKVQGVGELALCDVGTHPLRIRKGGTTYGIELVATDDPNASAIRIKTGIGIKAIRKYT